MVTYNKIKKGFNIRFENYDEIHENSEANWNVFLRAIDPKDNELILDGCGGNGDVSSRILEIANPEIIVVDNSKEQLDRLRQRKNLSDENLIFTNIRKTELKSEIFDKIVIKMGIHESPKKYHLEIFREMYRLLRKGGKIIIWELSLNKTNQKIFQDIIRQKDILSGFDNLAEIRYFPRHDELLNYFKKSGFKNFKDIYTKDYFPKPKLRNRELMSAERADVLRKNGRVSFKDEEIFDKISLKKQLILADYVRKRISSKLRKKMKFKDERGINVEFEVQKRIYVGWKG